jgi:hypothetical protein
MRPHPIDGRSQFGNVPSLNRGDSHLQRIVIERWSSSPTNRYRRRNQQLPIPVAILFLGCRRTRTGRILGNQLTTERQLEDAVTASPHASASALFGFKERTGVKCEKRKTIAIKNQAAISALSIKFSPLQIT